MADVSIDTIISALYTLAASVDTNTELVTLETTTTARDNLTALFSPTPEAVPGEDTGV